MSIRRLASPHLHFDKSIKFKRLYHRVSRYGLIYDITIQSLHNELFIIDNVAPVETLYNIMNLEEGDDVHIYSLIKKPSMTIPSVVIDDLPIKDTEKPICRACGTPLTIDLDDLSCPNPQCPERNKSRIYHFFKQYSIFKSDSNIALVVNNCSLDVNEPKSLANVFQVMSEDNSLEYRNLITLFGDINISMQNIHDHLSFITLVEFIDNLSIPNLTKSDIARVIMEFSENTYSSMFDIFEDLAHLVDISSSDPTRWFQEELLTIGDMIAACDPENSESDYYLKELEDRFEETEPISYFDYEQYLNEQHK